MKLPKNFHALHARGVLENGLKVGDVWLDHEGPPKGHVGPYYGSLLVDVRNGVALFDDRVKDGDVWKWLDQLARTPLSTGVPVACTEKLAFLAHMGHVDKTGKPIFDHLKGVHNIVKDALSYIPYALQGLYPNALHVAYLHDLFEDTMVCGRDLLAAHYSESVALHIEILTHDSAVPYEDYIDAVCVAGGTPLLVKWADNQHNGMAVRLASLDPATRDALSLRYESARVKLSAALIEEMVRFSA
jgi:hypothetical protein